MVTHYSDEEPHVEYRIRPTCQFCGGDVGCICFNYDNSDDPEKEAEDGLLRNWNCERVDCTYKAIEKYNPESLIPLIKKYGDDKWSIVEEILEKYPEQDSDGIYCEV